jgi:Uma2 family endonuclease
VASIAEISETLAEGAAFPPVPICRLGVEKYEEMVRAGIITTDDRVELLDGWLVPRMTQNPPHVLACELVRDALQRIVPQGWCIYSQKPVRLPTSLPEPDVMVVRGDLRHYRDRRIKVEDLGLVVEVSDTSLSLDQDFKKTIYAQAGVPIYWLVNLVDHRVEEYTNPTGPAEHADYRARHDYSSADDIPAALDGRHVAAIPVRDLLP